MQLLYRYLTPVFFILQIFAVQNASTQELRYRSDMITRDLGLSNSTVTSIIKDHFGFIWIGTWNGLNRFDGYDMTVFQFDPQDSSSISNSNVNMLFEDRDGTLWIATDNGLNSFDHITGKFRRYYFDSERHIERNNNQVNGITQDSKGFIWLGLQNQGLVRLDKNKGSFTSFQNVASESSNSIISIHADRLDRDFIWLGTADGLFIFNQVTGEFERKIPIKSEVPVSVQVFRQDVKGNLFIGTWGNGLIKFDRKTSTFLSCTAPEEKDAIIRAMSFDGKGNLVFDIRDRGLRKYNLSDGKVTRLEHGDISSELNDKVVTSMFIEPSGIMWLGTIYDGAIKIVSLVNSFHFYHLQATNGRWNGGGITAIVEDSHNDLWLGTRFGGLFKVDGKTGSIREYSTKQGLSNNNILSLLEVNEHNQKYLWIGTDGGGLNKLNITTGRFLDFKISGKGSENHKNSSVSTIIQYDENHLIFGTRNRNEGEGMYVLNIKTGNSVNFRYDPSDITSIGSNNVLSLFKDRSGVVWVGTRNGGLNKFIIKDLNALTPEKSGYFIRYVNDPNDPKTINNNTVYSIHDDTKNNLWIGTNNGGLSMFTPTTGEFTGDLLHYYLSDHLVYGILSDNNENLWISTSRGILAFNTSSGKIHSFDKFDGLRETVFIYGSYYKSSSGELFFGGMRGCNSFHPDSIKLNLKVPRIVITSFTISGRKGTGSVSELTRKSVTASKKVSTPYYQNNIALTFSALDYNMPAKNRFRYKLEGYDIDWTETNASRRYVNYTNLAPGKYIFKVIGSNSDDIWNHEGTSIVIIIEPPFWRTTFFYVFLTICTAGLIAFLLYIFIRKYKKEKEQLALEAISSVQDEKKQLRTLIDNIPDLIFIKDRQSRFTLANTRVASVMGTVPENLIGKTDFDFYAEDTARDYFNDEQRIMETGIPMINVEENAHDEFGNRAIRSTTKVPVRNKTGEIIGIAGVCRDITKLKKIENQLRKKTEDLQETNRLLENRQKDILIQSEELAEQTQNLLMINSELERLNRTKDKLFSIIAHDLRNPFNAIIGFSELLRHDFYDMDNVQKLNLLELISISSQTAYNLLENLLQWARTQTDKINFNPEHFNLHEIAGNVINLHCVTARKKGISIKNDIGENIQVFADKNMISTVLRNLVSNAIKFTNPEGKIVISVKDNARNVEVNISDTGIGMDRDSLNKLFRIDTYYSTAGTMGESGTGLGLIICKEFVEKNNGRIKAVSNEGKGTTMMFTLSKGQGV